MATRNYWETVPGRWPESPPIERLTAAGVEYLATHQTPPPKNDARADSVSGDGLKMTTTYDFSGRPTYEFTNTGNRKQWLDPYKAVPQLQLALNIKNEPQDIFESKRGKHLADMKLREQAARDLAAGKQVLCDLSVPMERQS